MKNTEKVTKLMLVDDVYEKAIIEYRVNKKIKCNFSKEDVAFIVTEFLDSLTNQLKKGASIELRGFGSFEKKTRAARTNVRNPKTGEQTETAAHSVVAFKAGRELKQAVWDL